MAQRTLFFDLDETLVSSNYGAPATVPRAFFVDEFGEVASYGVFVRSDAEAALLAARNHFDAVHVFTAATRPYALAVLEAAGLRDLVDEVYTLDDVFFGKQAAPNVRRGKWALVDNDEGIAMSKISNLAVGEPIHDAMRRYWIPIKDFAPADLREVAKFSNHDLLLSVYEAEQRVP